VPEGVDPVVDPVPLPEVAIVSVHMFCVKFARMFIAALTVIVEGFVILVSRQ